MFKWVPILLFSAVWSVVAEAGEVWDKDISHRDHIVESSGGVQIFVREFETPDTLISEYPLLMLHGGGPGVVASFDIDVPGGSFAKDLVRAGFKVYMMDIRGWESSTLPDYNLKDRTLVVGSHKEAAEDIGQVVQFIQERDNIDKVSFFGWATGGHWGGYYASLHSGDLAHFISLNSLYGVNAPWELRQFFWTEEDSTQYNKQGHFRTSSPEGLVRKWQETIPIADKNRWRDSLVMDGYRQTALSFGSDTSTMVVPGGYREESFYMSLGKKYWDAKDIRVPCLIIRTELDFWSRPEDLEAFRADLTQPGLSRFLTLPGTHYVFLDLPDRGRAALIQAISDFVSGA